MEPVKILLTTPYDLTVEGGVNSHLWGLYHELKRQPRFEVKILAPSSRPIQSQNGNVITAGKVTVLRMNGAKSNVTLDFGVRKTVREVLNRFQPDIIHLQEPLYPLLNYYVLKYSSSKNIGTFHTFSKERWRYRLAKPILYRNFKKLDLKLAVSEAARQYIAQFYPGNYKLIPNGIALKSTSKPVEKLYQDEKKNILYVGRMDEPRKGFQYMLDAFTQLEKDFPGRFRLLAVGNGYHKWTGKYTCRDIVWLGRMPDEKLQQMYASCDLLCTSSTGGESFGMIIVEAFSFGKPVVAFEIEGHNEVIRHGENGMLVANKDAKGLANAVARILNSAEVYQSMSQLALCAAQKYDWRIITDKIISCYDQILNGRSKTFLPPA